MELGVDQTPDVALMAEVSHERSALHADSIVNTSHTEPHKTTAPTLNKINFQIAPAEEDFHLKLHFFISLELLYFVCVCVVTI